YRRRRDDGAAPAQAIAAHEVDGGIRTRVGERAAAPHRHRAVVAGIDDDANVIPAKPTAAAHAQRTARAGAPHAQLALRLPLYPGHSLAADAGRIAPPQHPA